MPHSYHIYQIYEASEDPSSGENHFSTGTYENYDGQSYKIYKTILRAKDNHNFPVIHKKLVVCKNTLQPRQSKLLDKRHQLTDKLADDILFMVPVWKLPKFPFDYKILRSKNLNKTRVTFTSKKWHFEPGTFAEYSVEVDSLPCRTNEDNWRF